MSNRYKLILSNKTIYREVDLSDAQKTVRIGTTTGCDIRLSSSLFFTNIELTIALQNDAWTLTCSDNVYISVDNVRKLMFTQLAHGDHLHIKYRASDNDVFVVDFAADFDYAEKDYNRIIDISGVRQFTIGTSGSCDISLKSEFLKNDQLRVENQGDMLLLKLQNSTYGIYKNGQRVTSGSAKIYNRDFFSLGEYSFYYKDRQLYTTESDGMMVSQLPTHILRESKSAMTYPKFNRSTRVLVKIPDEEIPVLDPPQAPQKQKRNLLLTILPSLLMVVMIIFLRGMMAGSGGNLSYVLMSAGMMGMGVVTSIITYFSTKKEYREEMEKRTTDYKAYIEEKKKEIEEYRNEERNLMNHIYYDVEKELHLAQSFSGDLFNRRPEDEDYLCVRLGTGTIEAIRKIGWKKQEAFASDDELVLMPEQIADAYKDLPQAPITTNLKEANAIGVVGTADACYGVLKNMVIDLVIRHYYKDVKLFFLISPEEAQQFRWVRQLPHVVNDEIGIRNIAFDTDSRTTLFEYLYRVLSARAGQKGPFQELVIFAFDAKGIKSHPLSQFMEHASELGVTFVFFDRDKALLPQFCKDIITLDSAESGVLLKTEDENSGIPFSYHVVPDTVAERVASKLAPIYCEEVSLESTLTKSITLFELLQIYSPDDLNLDQRWASSAVDKSMAAPLGVKSKNEIVYLDLHEKYHGPHGLVAGTTGSGKSEILQSYILSMTTLFHPYEVSFLIIDFKGGGMVNQFRDLPHLVGAITNIDGKEIERSLRSIKAELLKRQEYFAEADVNHIDKYIRKYKCGEVTKPLPHLIIIVDEFAELKAEQPEFMKELISTARIGRSLGVHLILATQKPAGQVNEQIWSNSKFKLCLKVQTKEDSNEVLKSPLAAEIKEPGRAYLQVGNNEIFELFQSGYSGAPEKGAEDSRMKEYQLNTVDLSGRRKQVFSQKKTRLGEDSRTQLEALVNYVNRYCERKNIAHLPPICLPSLPELLPFPKPQPAQFADGVFVDVGMFDDPDSQYQGVIHLSITGQNTIIIGSAQYGKTTMLQTIIRGLATNYSASEVNIYIIDFASMVLKNFETLPHVGGVVCSSDDEKLKNLFKLMIQEIEIRKQKLVSTGVSSFSAYLEAGYTDLPQIILMVDNVTALREMYLQDNDVLLTICREGATVGLSVIMANAQTSGFGYRYLSNFSNRFALFCNDSTEYNSLFNVMRVAPSKRPGSVLIEQNKAVFEGQVYLPFEGIKEIERVTSIQTFIQEMVALRPNEKTAKKIPMLPAVLTMSAMMNEYYRPSSLFEIAGGLDYSSIEPVVLPLQKLGLVGISGQEGTDTHNWVLYVAESLQQQAADSVELYIVDGIEKKLAPLQQLTVTTLYSTLPTAAKDAVVEIEGKLKERYDAVLRSETVEDRLLVLILDNPDAVDAISADSNALSAYKNIASRYKQMGVCVLLTGIENESIPYSAPEMLKTIRDTHQLVFFGNISELKLFDVPLSISKQFKKPVEKGDAYFFKGNNCTKMMTPRCESTELERQALMK